MLPPLVQPAATISGSLLSLGAKGSKKRIHSLRLQTTQKAAAFAESGTDNKAISQWAIVSDVIGGQPRTDDYWNHRVGFHPGQFRRIGRFGRARAGVDHAVREQTLRLVHF